MTEWTNADIIFLNSSHLLWLLPLRTAPSAPSCVWFPELLRCLYDGWGPAFCLRWLRSISAICPVQPALLSAHVTWGEAQQHVEGRGGLPQQPLEGTGSHPGILARGTWQDGGERLTLICQLKYALISEHISEQSKIIIITNEKGSWWVKCETPVVPVCVGHAKWKTSQLNMELWAPGERITEAS